MQSYYLMKWYFITLRHNAELLHNVALRGIMFSTADCVFGSISTQAEMQLQEKGLEQLQY